MPETVNPYIAGSPVTGTEMFFGRDDVFEFVRQALTGRHRDNVIVLYGQRRTGKTSVLYQMRLQLGTRYLPIFVDLHGLALESISGFLWELVNHIARALRRDYQIDLPHLNRVEFMTDPRGHFENEFLNQVWSAIDDRHVLLMLDEAIRLQEQVQAGKLEKEIFEYLRHLMQHHERLNFLFSLGSGLEEMEKEYSFLFSVGLYKKISFLSPDAARSLITQPVRDHYQIEPLAIERILQITAGHPYYTQLLCHSLFNLWQRQTAMRIQAEDVDGILDEVVERGLAVLKHVWEESTSGEKAIIAGVAAAMGEYNRRVSLHDIHRAWARHDVRLPEGEKAKAIKSLIARDLITGQNKYVFTVDLQRLWVREYERLEWVKEEIADEVKRWKEPLVKPRTAWQRRLTMFGAGLAGVIGLIMMINPLINKLRIATPTLESPTFSAGAQSSEPLTATSPAALLSTAKYPDGRRFKLFYDENGFYLLNLSDTTIPISWIAFERLGTDDTPLNRFNGSRWAEFYSESRPGWCTAIKILQSASHLDPPECDHDNMYLSVRTPSRGDPTIFWTAVEGSREFRILWREGDEDEEVARCKIGVGTCDVYFP